MNNIVAIQNRIALLKTRKFDNNSIIKKLERQLRAMTEKKD